MALDRINREILAALQNDARLSNKELAEAVGLAPSSCSVRVSQLRDEGVLQGAHAQVNPKAIGIGLQAMISIRMRQHSKRDLDRFAKHVSQVPEVVVMYHMAGASDFLIHVAVRDAEHLRHLAIDQFTTRSEVDHMETALIFEFHRAGALPMYHQD